MLQTTSAFASIGNIEDKNKGKPLSFYLEKKTNFIVAY